HHVRRLLLRLPIALLAAWLLSSCLQPQSEQSGALKQYREEVANFIIPGEEELLVLARTGNDPSREEVEAVYRRHYQTRIETALNTWGNRQLQGLAEFYDENFSLESSLHWTNARGLRGAIEAVVPLYAAEDKAWFLQPGAVIWEGFREQKRRDFNLGVVHRRFLRGRRMAVGFAAFYDNSAAFGLSRFGLGIDAQDEFNYVSAHFYMPLQKEWSNAGDNYQERVTSGMELYMRRQLLRRIDLTAAFIAWRRYEEITGRDLGFGPGVRTGLDWEIARGLSLETSYEQRRTDNDARWQVNLRFRLPAQARTRGAPRLDLWRPFEHEQRVLYAERRNVRMAVKVPDARAGEGDGTVQLQLQLPQALDGAVVGYVIPYSGTGYRAALAEIDFNASRRLFVIAAGKTGADVDIPVMEDDLIEHDETFHVKLKLYAAPPHVIAGAPARITIMDNDNSATGGRSIVDATLSAQPQSVSENAGEIPVIVTAELSQPAPRAARIELTFAIMPRGRAVAAPPNAIKIARDSGSGVTTFMLNITDTRDEDGDAEIRIKAGAVEAIKEVRETHVVIKDDDPLSGMLAIAGALRESAANDGSVDGSLRITLRGAARFAETLTPAFTNTPPGLTPQVTRDSDTQATLRLAGNADAHASADSITGFTIEFDDDDFGNTRIGHIAGASAANLRIDFTDTPVLRAGAAALSVREGEAATITLTLNRAVASNVDVEGAYALTDGSAAAATDYTAPAESARTFRIPAGATSTTVRIDTTDNDIDDGNRTFTLRLVRANDNIAMLGAPSQVTVTIIDDESTPQLSVFSRAISAREDAGSVDIRLRLSHRSSSPVTGSYAITGSADGAADYTAPSPRMFTINAGETITTIKIMLHDDRIDELDEDARLLVMRANDEFATLGSALTVLTILDNDDPPALIASDASVTEAEGARATVMLTLTGGGSSRSITGNYHLTAGSAVAGEDYVSAPGAFTFSPAEDSTALRIHIVNNDISEPDEHFTLTVRVTDPSLVRLARGIAQVTIMDDEGPPIMQIAADALSVEEGEPAAVMVNLNRESSRAIRGIYTLADGSATGNVDYNSADGDFVIAAGARAANVRVETIEDDTYEEDETFTLNIALAPGERGARLGAPASALVTIANDDPAPLTITPMPANKIYGTEDPKIDYTATFVKGHTKNQVFSEAPIERIAGETAGVYAYRLKSPLPYVTGFENEYDDEKLAGTGAFTINPKPLGYARTAANKEYDGTRNAPESLGGDFSGIVVATLKSGRIDDSTPDRLTIEGGVFADKTAGNNKVISGITLTGTAAGNYTLPDVRGDITHKEVTYTSAAADKMYDNTTDAPASLGGAFAASGIIADDTVFVQGGAYAHANAGAGIVIKDFMLDGADARNYVLASGSSVSGEIIKRRLRVTAGGSGATVPAAPNTLLSIIRGDLLDVHIRAEILTGEIVFEARMGATSRIVTGMLTVKSGLPAENYTLDFTDGVFTYTALQQLTITPMAASKVYGADDPALGYGANFIDDDTPERVFSAIPFARTTGENAQAYAYQLKGALPFNADFADKYSVTLAGANSFDITRKPLRYDSTTANKVYDGAPTRPTDLGGMFTGIVVATVGGID
ncbi:MAG: YDG domain-containing protein, partial [Gammaproteobacteria bacterium]